MKIIVDMLKVWTRWSHIDCRNCKISFKQSWKDNLKVEWFHCVLNHFCQRFNLFSSWKSSLTNLIDRVWVEAILSHVRRQLCILLRWHEWKETKVNIGFATTDQSSIDVHHNLGHRHDGFDYLPTSTDLRPAGKRRCAINPSVSPSRSERCPNDSCNRSPSSVAWCRLCALGCTSWRSCFQPFLGQRLCSGIQTSRRQEGHSKAKN